MNQEEIQQKIDLVMSDPKFFGNRDQALEIVQVVYLGKKTEFTGMVVKK
jgi:hypothetical protein